MVVRRSTTSVSGNCSAWYPSLYEDGLTSPIRPVASEPIASAAATTPTAIPPCADRLTLPDRAAATTPRIAGTAAIAATAPATPNAGSRPIGAAAPSPEPTMATT